LNADAQSVLTPPDPNATSEARVMRLKGYGNAIVAPAAVAWIETVMECAA